MKSRFRTLFFITLFTYSSLLTPLSVSAQTPTPDVHCLIPDPSGSGGYISDPNKVYVAIINDCLDSSQTTSVMMVILVMIGVFAAVYRISMGFFLITTAEGDPARLQEGREAITEAILGVVVVAGAYALMVFLNALIPENWQINIS